MQVSSIKMNPIIKGYNIQPQAKIERHAQSDIAPKPKYDALTHLATLGAQTLVPKKAAVNFTGWSPEPHNKEMINKMVKVMTDPTVQKIAVSGHTSPDGDSFGSSFAMANLINQATGKKVDVFVFGPLPKRYEYLNTNPDVKVIEHLGNKNWKKGDEAAQKYGKYDLAISLDCAENKLMAGDYANGVFKRATNSMKIDHHPFKEEFNEKWGRMTNNKFAKMNLIDSSLPAAAEIVMQFVEPLGLKPEALKKEAKEAMFTGMVTDTGCFKYANTPMTFEDAALLMKAGVSNRETNLNAIGNTPGVVLEVEKLCLDKIQYSDNKKVAYVIEDEDIKAAKKACKDAGYAQEGKDAVKAVCGRLPELEGVEVGFKVYQMPGRASFSIRSREMDVSEIARKYEGGGHKNAAAFMVSNNGRTTEEVVADIVKELNQKMPA